MIDQSQKLFDLDDPNQTSIPVEDSLYPTGILPSQTLRQLILEKTILSTENPIQGSQIQPASLDLRLGSRAYRVRTSFLPGKECSVKDKIDQFGMHQLDLTRGAVFERGAVYIVQLQEGVNLTRRLYGIANPKRRVQTIVKKINKIKIKR